VSFVLFVVNSSVFVRCLSFAVRNVDSIDRMDLGNGDGSSSSRQSSRPIGGGDRSAVHNRAARRATSDARLSGGSD